MDKMNTLAFGGKRYVIDDPDSVSFMDKQDLSSEHQAQARENIGAAGKEKDYELIDTITLTEDAALNLTKEPDGTPYSFEAVLITGLANVGTLASKFLFCFNNENTKYSRGEIQDASKQKTAFTTEMWIERGIWRNTSVTGTNTYYGTIKGDNYRRVHNFDPNTSNHKHITQILTDGTLTAGSIVNIYAIRKEV